MKYALSVILIVVGLAGSATAARIHTETIQYTVDGEVMEGYLAYDAQMKGKRPGVLVVHEWWGINDYIKGRTEQLARLGYVAFAADIYGKGKRAKTPEEAGKLAGIYRNDRRLLRARANAGLAALRNVKGTDGSRLAAIGYCFGGMTVLELARSGADVRGVASFHGTLDTPNPADAKNIKGSVLILQGADDPYVPMAQRTAFQDEMEKGGVDWQMNVYGHSVHSFTNPASGDDPSKGVAYNGKADKRSWEAMKIFFKEIFAEQDTLVTRGNRPLDSAA
jgi:dienelactone hydrolase